MESLDSNKPSVSILERLKGESYLLAIAPFIGSYLAFVYEVGYLSHYEVPITFIQLDFTRIITATAVTIVSFTGLFYFLKTAVDIGKEGQHPLYKIISQILFVCIFVSCFLYLLPGHPEKWWFILAYISYQILFKLILTIPKNSESENYWDRVSLAISSNSDRHKKSESEVFFDFTTSLILIFYGSFLVGLLGNNLAAEKTFYWTLDDQQDMILIANYNDTLIFKKIILSTNEITDYLELHKINEATPIKMSHTQIGKLKDKRTNIQQ